MDDLPRIAATVSSIRGETVRLHKADEQIVRLVAFVCEALCDIQPELRRGLTARLLARLDAEFPESDADHNPSDTLRAGLQKIVDCIHKP